MGRYRLAVFGLAVLLGVGLGILRTTASDQNWELFSLGGLVVQLGALVLALFLIYGFRPATLITRPETPAFVSHPPAGLVMLLAAVALQNGTNLVSYARDVNRGGFDLVMLILSVTLLVLLGGLLSRKTEVRLRPDGIEDQQALGTLFVPWETFTGVPYPAFPVGRTRIALTYGRPELLRSIGWRPSRTKLSAVGIHARFLSYAIHEYAHRPDLRPAIGTEAELARLTEAWQVHSNSR
ncbi:hypothetical protein GCM10009828_074280 [Actinoplanes couchii]|uniref:Uncharacterized protein n=1 Tax=Actinoplanes couchii TaxID=403638 RepID=A0ABQ3X002_9ACTN|nr:hypothetical protein Aco03nite_002660 [Actinoplanes couchii]